MLLDKKIKDKTAKIAVVGLGYVGLPLAIEFVKAGFDVLGIDVDKKKVNSINNGENYIKDIDDITLRDAVDSNSLNATDNFSLVKDIDFISNMRSYSIE